MADWIKFENTVEQQKFLEGKDCILKCKDGSERMHAFYHEIDSFLICEPHPHRDMIIEWANTGRPVYCKNIHGEWRLTTEPSWTPEIEYSFDPPKEKIRYRVALMRKGINSKWPMIAGDREEEYFESSPDFIKWLTDRQEVEIDG